MDMTIAHSSDYRRLIPWVAAVLVLLTVLSVLLQVSPASAQDGAPAVPDTPTGKAIFRGGVDLEWNEVSGAESYDVNLYRDGEITLLPGEDVEIAFYGAGAVISGLNETGASTFFQVRANNEHGSSDWSEWIVAPLTGEKSAGEHDRPANSPATGAPTLSGTAQAGETLTADTSGIADENGLDRVKFYYQWVTGEGDAEEDIEGATETTYTLTEAEADQSVRVRVSFTDRMGYAETLRSAAMDAAPASNRPATGAPTIDGTAQVGQALTADTTGIADADGLDNADFAYQWLADDAAISATRTYTLVAADQGIHQLTSRGCGGAAPTRARPSR